MNNSIIDKTQPKLKQPFESVGRLIITMRESYGWNQCELAEKVQCTPSCVSSWESGRMLPQGKNILRLAGVFEMTPRDILMGMSCLETAEQETPEQAELTNRVLKQTVTESTYYGIPESELNPDFFQKYIVPESDQDVEVHTGTYKGDDKPAFSLIFSGTDLASVRIVHRCKTIDLTPSDFPSLLIDLLSEAARVK